MAKLDSLASQSLGDLVRRLASVITLVNDIRAKVKGNYLMSNPVLAIGSTKTHVSTVAFDYIVGGVKYAKTAVAAGTAPGNDVVPQGKFGAIALDIGTNGTLDVIEAAANAAGYTTAALAIAGLPAPATDHVRVGTVTGTKSDGTFTFGTTELDVANSTVAYTSAQTAFQLIGSAAA